MSIYAPDVVGVMFLDDPFAIKQAASFICHEGPVVLDMPTPMAAKFAERLRVALGLDAANQRPGLPAIHLLEGPGGFCFLAHTMTTPDEPRVAAGLVLGAWSDWMEAGAPNAHVVYRQMPQRRTHH